MKQLLKPSLIAMIFSLSLLNICAQVGQPIKSGKPILIDVKPTNTTKQNGGPAKSNLLIAPFEKYEQVWLKTVDTPLLYRFQYTYDANTHKYNKGYTNYLYTLSFITDNCYFESGTKYNSTGNSHVTQPGEPGYDINHSTITPGLGPSGSNLEHFIQRWSLHIIATKDGNLYKDLKFDPYWANVGSFPPPYINLVTVQGTGNYIFYTVQTFPDSSTMHNMLAHLINENGGTMADRENEIITTIQKYKNLNLLEKTIFKPIARFSAHNDILIVGIGDFYSSGEGNPETCGYRNTDNDIFGKVCSFIMQTSTYTGKFIMDFSGLRSTIDGLANGNLVEPSVIDGVKKYFEDTYEYFRTNELTEAITGNVNCPSCQLTLLHQIGDLPCTFDVQPNWVEPQAHRSYRSSTALAAFDIERKHPENVTTFLTFASSGARVPDLIEGPQHPWQQISQIDELKKAIGSRTIDALVLAIGVNDIDFHSNLEELVKNNDPDVVKQNIESKILILKQRYQELNDKIKNSLKVKYVYILEYPAPLFSKYKKDGSIVDEESCGVFKQVNGHYEINSQGAKLLHALGDELNNTIKEAANKYGWVYVGGISNDFLGHGYCSDDHPMYRFAEESCKCQGDTDGELHPNELGHSIVEKHLLKEIEKNQNFNLSNLQPNNK